MEAFCTKFLFALQVSCLELSTQRIRTQRRGPFASRLREIFSREALISELDRGSSHPKTPPPDPKPSLPTKPSHLVWIFEDIFLSFLSLQPQYNDFNNKKLRLDARLGKGTQQANSEVHVRLSCRYILSPRAHLNSLARSGR